jgi:predicted nucleotidyltransferase component of viral defense system
MFRSCFLLQDTRFDPIQTVTPFRLLQHIEKLHTRGWSRSRARDYYDLWRIIGTYGDRLEVAGFASFLRKKCATRDVRFEGAEDFFQNPMLSYVEATWEQWLGRLVPGLPSFETVIGELRPQIAELLGSGE